MSELTRIQTRYLHAIVDECGLVFDRSEANLRLIAANLGGASRQQVLDMIRWLASKGVLAAEHRGAGRGNPTRFRVREPYASRILVQPKKEIARV